MAHIEVDVTSSDACKSPRTPGIYLNTIHWVWDRRLRHDQIGVGKNNPLGVPIGQLVVATLREIDEGVAMLEQKKPKPFGRIVGMSVVRACIHPIKTPEGRRSAELRAERVGAFMFVGDESKPLPIVELKQTDRPSAYDVTKVQVLHNGQLKYIPTQFLAASPEQKEAYAPSHAIETLAATGTTGEDVLGGLRARGENEFLETIVTEEELMDSLR